MKITRVRAWEQHLAYVEGSYYMSGGRLTTGMDTVVIQLDTDEGVSGIGESGTIGVTYDAAFPGGQAAGVRLLAPHLIGVDPRSPHAAYRVLTANLAGHGYAKAGIDMAIWDLAAQSAGLALWQLLGGSAPESTPLYRPVQGATVELSVAKAAERLAQGYRRLQVKVGDDPRNDARRVLAVRDAVGPDVAIYADANCGFSLAAARTFVASLDGADIVLEQPCATLHDCAALRSSWAGPMVIDENNVSLNALLEAHRLGIADGVTVKLSRVGGITPATLMRNVAVELGIHVTVEDASGGDLVDWAFAHLNASTPAKYRAHTVDFGGWVTRSYVGSSPRSADGSAMAPSADRPGLGVLLDHDILGAPFIDVTS